MGEDGRAVTYTKYVLTVFLALTIVVDNLPGTYTVMCQCLEENQQNLRIRPGQYRKSGGMGMKTARLVTQGRKWLGCFIFLLGALGAKAQVDTGTILGTVTDTTGAIVANARVTIVNQATAAPLTTTTREDGQIRVYAASYRYLLGHR